MSSAEDVQNTNGILALPRFQKCMGRVPSDEKIPDDMSDEGKCTVLKYSVHAMRVCGIREPGQEYNMIILN
eukprot:COSAG02_NODE_3243_length_7108_cov_5.440291_6_plen_71_part_00